MNRIALFVLISFSLLPWRNAIAQADHARFELRSLQDVTRAAPSPQDRELNEAVRVSLTGDGDLSPALGDVQLKTVERVVHLKGTVGSENEKRAIEEKVREHPGVTGVTNFLEVGGNR